MFYNSGKKIRWWATALFFIESAAMLICEYLFWDIIGGIKALIITIFAILGFYIKNMFLAAFGEMVEDIHSIRMDGIDQYDKRMYPNG